MVNLPWLKKKKIDLKKFETLFNITADNVKQTYKQFQWMGAKTIGVNDGYIKGYNKDISIKIIMGSYRKGVRVNIFLKRGENKLNIEKDFLMKNDITQEEIYKLFQTIFAWINLELKMEKI